MLAAATELEREGRDIVHLEIGQPGFPSPEHVIEAGVDAIRGGKTKYSSPTAPPRSARQSPTTSPARATFP